jgi:tetratricopeptide (TPR) repeat protein
VILVALTLFATAAQAQDAEAIFQRANTAYFQGDYQGAARDYGLLIESGVDDPDVTYNLATAHARLGNYGQAIRYYERTLRLRPGDDDARAGLTKATDALGRATAEQEGEATLETRPSFTENLVRPFSENALAWLVLALDALAFGLLIAFRFVRAEAGRLGLGVAIPIAFVLFALALGGLAIKSRVFAEGEAAVVVGKDPVLREGPDPRAAARSSVHEGERVEVLADDGQFVQVRFANGRAGWMARADVGTI